MQLIILCTYHYVLPHDLQNSRCAVTLFAIYLQGQVVTFWKYVANASFWGLVSFLIVEFLEIGP